MLILRMLKRCRRAALSGATAIGIVLAAAPLADAGGYGGDGVDCSSAPAECTLYAQISASQGSDRGSSGARSSGAGHGASGAGSQGSSPTSSGSGVIPPLLCSDIPFLAIPVDLLTRGLAQPPGPGHWVLRTCLNTLTPLLITPIPVWVPAGASALPDPRVLAAQALSKLVLPAPVIESSPGGGVPQTVELPTWAWLQKNQWTPLSATASVPGESVTATATPSQVTWSWGDGTSTICHGPGTPYVAGTSDPAASSPDCGHTYRQTSATQPGEKFPATATITWTVAWNGGGQAGTLPDLTTSSTVHWTVRQIQSLIISR